MPVSAPADKRFRRSQVRPAPRPRWRQRRVRLLVWSSVLVLILTLGYSAGTQALTARSLAISRISVVGNQRISTGEVHALLAELKGANMLTADLQSAKQKLLASPWVAEVEMRRLFPAGVSVALVERDAAALGRIGSHLYLIDEGGEIIDAFGPNYAEFDLPIVDGLGAAEGGGSLVDARRARVAVRLLAALQSRPDLASRVSQIDVSDPRDVVVVLKGDTVLVKLGSEHFVERLQSYVELGPTLRQRVGGIDYVDLRYGDRVFVKPQRQARPVPRTR